MNGHFKEWYEGIDERTDESFNIDDYNLEECDYREEDGTMRLELKEYDRLLRIEKKYLALLEKIRNEQK